MFVSLLSDVRSLGPAGAIVDVPEGYAQSFLFPEHLAVLATKDVVAKDKALDDRPKETKIEQAERELAGEIDGLEVVIPVALDKGKLDEPVSVAMIRQGLKDMGYKVPFDAIKTKDIAEVGTVDVPVVFPSGFESTISVVIEAA